MTREEAKELLSRAKLILATEELQTAIDMAIEALQTDLVQCRDCRFYWGNLSEDDTDEMYGECRWDSDEMPNADDFCSYGERREPDKCE